jgi:hypothetical protein
MRLGKYWVSRCLTMEKGKNEIVLRTPWYVPACIKIASWPGTMQNEMRQKLLDYPSN